MSEDYSDIKEYLIELSKKLKERQLDNFWVKCDNVDFKPIKDVTKTELKKK